MKRIGKKHIDENKKKERSANLAALRELIYLNDEDGFVAMLKAIKPNVSKEELVEAVLGFRREAVNAVR